VGVYFDGTSNQALIETWNGTNWTITASPGLTSTSSILTAVSCTSATACITVGDYTAGGEAYTLVESWNGSAWSIIPSPSPSSSGFEPFNELDGVSCSGSPVTACAAVGYTNLGSTGTQALSEVWNGSTWSVVPTDNPGTTENILYGVSCAGPNFCFATGYDAGASGTETLIERWDGSSWSIAPSPNEGLDDFIGGVTCSDPTDCITVGSYDAASGPSRALVESWDGSSWSIDASADRPSNADRLGGVACANSGTCVAVGAAQHLSQNLRANTLIESGRSGATLTISPSSLPGGSIGQPYTAALSASGGNPPYTWKVVPGTGKLPRGVTLGATSGVISGTPVAAGTYRFTVRVQDQPLKKPKTQNAGDQVFSITVT
jgi:hypothetical protein